MMTFKEAYAKEMDMIVPSDGFDQRLLQRLQSETPDASGVIRLVRRWKTAALILSAACFTLLIGVGSLSVLLGSRSDAALLQYTDTARYDMMQVELTAIPKEEMAEEAAVITDDAVNEGAIEAEEPKGAPTVTEEKVTAGTSNMSIEPSSDAIEEGIWLDGLYALQAGDILTNFAAMENVSAIARVQNASTAEENGLMEAAIPYQLSVTLEDLRFFIQQLYTAKVLHLSDGTVYDPETDTKVILGTDEPLRFHVYFSDGEVISLALYADRYITLGGFPVAFQLDEAATDTIARVLTQR